MLKKLIKKIIPLSLEVPFKYYYNFFIGTLEYELNIIDYILRPGDRAIDVGANRGVYSYKLWKNCINIEIFEPNPICVKVLSAWINNKSSINLHAHALSNKDGFATLNIPIDENGVEHDASASLNNLNFIHKRSEDVSIRSLDSYNFSNVSFIKIDVEGHERLVLEGAKKTLLNHKPSLLIEIEQRHSSDSINMIFDYLTNLDYEGFFFVNNLGVVVY